VGLPPAQAMENLLAMLKRSKTNAGVLGIEAA
jgi:hypothetical protein